MADNRYQPPVYRRADGVAFVVADEGFIEFEEGGYTKTEVVVHTTDLSPLSGGVMNTMGDTTTITVVLPAPVSGMDVWVANLDQSTASFNIRAATTVAGGKPVVGSSTEAGTFVDNNTILLSTGGCVHHLMAVNSSQWLVISNVGASACTTILGTSL